MKLHRLVLTNFRGIAHREIDFPDHGVVVVCGANEIGKSSMIEALDLLLEYKDRSTKKDVKQVKPTHADVGTEVSAEISMGPYHFVYRKRFHKQPETQLTVLAPRREQLTGDQAHERVRAMLAETVDTGLWHAQRVLQAASTAAVDLSGCDALSRALDIAAGDASAPSGTEPLLLERIEAEYARYFTPTGRATGEWGTATARLRDAEQEVELCTAAVAEVDERVHRHGALTDQLAELAGLQVVADARHIAAQTAAGTVAKLTEQLREARLIATAAAATSAASTAAHAERLRLHTEISTRSTKVAVLEAEVRTAVDTQSSAHKVATDAETAAERATQLLTTARERAESARRIVDQLSALDEADRLAARLAKIDAAQRERDQVGDELSRIVLSQAAMARIEAAAATVDRVEGQLALMSATVEVTATADIELTADGQRFALAAGQSWSTMAAGPTEVEVPGVLTARFRPGATAVDIQAKYSAAQEELAVCLTAGEVGDLAAARDVDQRRRDLWSTRDQLSATLAGLCGDDQVEDLRSRLAWLRARQSVDAGARDAGMSVAAAAAEFDTADADRARAVVDCETRRQTAVAAARELTEKSIQVTVLQEKLATQRSELDAVGTRLAQQRAAISDEELGVTADCDLRAAHAAELRVAELTELLAAAAPDKVRTELAEAVATVQELHAHHGQTARALTQVGVELAVFGTQGRQSKLDIAQTAREHAAAEYCRIGRRARAAQLLRSVMTRHRDDARLRYVEPFRAELQRLGRPVFGPSFEVEVDSELRIRSRTVDGCTVPYESLSGGAKEQLGILVRLAAAALVAKEDSVPVLIDDALGFTDPTRLAKMGAVFDMVGAAGQVIVLTCTPGRYQGVEGAHRIDLCA